jgi:hypothetical protein
MATTKPLQLAASASGSGLAAGLASAVPAVPLITAAAIAETTMSRIVDIDIVKSLPCSTPVERRT